MVYVIWGAMKWAQNRCMDPTDSPQAIHEAYLSESIKELLQVPEPDELRSQLKYGIVHFMHGHYHHWLRCASISKWPGPHLSTPSTTSKLHLSMNRECQNPTSLCCRGQLSPKVDEWVMGNPKVLLPLFIIPGFKHELLLPVWAHE